MAFGYRNMKAIEKVAEMAAMIEEHGEAWAKFAEYEGIEYATLERFEEAYAGEWLSEEDFAEQLARRNDGNTATPGLLH